MVNFNFELRILNLHFVVYEIIIIFALGFVNHLNPLIFAMSEENIAIRLKRFLEYKGLTNSQFADICGIPRPTLSQFFSGRNKKISDLLIGQIHGAFPELSVMWLMFGEGEMLSASEPVSPVEGMIAADSEEPAPYGTSSPEFFTETGLETSYFTPKRVENQVDSATLRIRELERQIEKLRKNPRKVVQITIYYDDNTFETFRN